jgi:hypothetical protein
MFVLIVILFITALLIWYTLGIKKNNLTSHDVMSIYNDQSENQYLQLNLPVLGNQGSGKTVFLATLSNQLVKERPIEVTQVLSAEYLTADQEKYLQFDHEPNQSRKESTRDLAQSVLNLFHQNELLGTKEPQDLFLSMTFGVEDTSQKEFITHFIDLPGSFFENEQVYSSNIDQRLKASDALIYVIDMDKLLPIIASHLQHNYNIDEEQLAWQQEHLNQSLEEYAQLYRKTLKSVIQLKSRQHFPIWIVISKVDMIKELHPIQSDYQIRINDVVSVIKRYFCDALLVPGVEIPHHISLISAHSECSYFWSHITQGAVEFFQSIKTQIHHRLDTAKQNNQSIIKYQKWRTLMLGILLLSIIPLIQGAQYINLPSISISKSWDLNSLRHYTKIYESFVKPSALNAFKTLYAYEVTQDIRTLNQLHDDLLQTYQQDFLRELPQYSLHTWKQKNQHEYPSINKLEKIQNDLKQFYEKFNHMNLQNHRSHSALQSSHRIVQQFKTWITHVHVNANYQDLVNGALALNHIVEWQEACKSSQRQHQELDLANHVNTPYVLIPSCVLYRYGVQEQKRLFQSAIAASQMSHTEDKRPIEESISQIKPLFIVYNGINEGLEHKGIMDQVRRNIQETWIRIWKHFDQHYPKSEKQTDSLRQLELLKNFDDQIKELADQLKMIRKQLAVPLRVNQEWQERLKNACMRARGQKGYNLEKFNKLIRWAKPYLDPMRQQQLNFEENQRNWKQQIQKALQKNESTQLDEVLKGIHETLYQFDTYQDKRAIRAWRQRVKQFKVLGSLRSYQISLSDISCDKNQLEINQIQWNDQLLGMDRLTPYIRIQSQGKEIKLFEDEEETIDWKAWGNIELTIMDKDLKGDDPLVKTSIHSALGLFSLIPKKSDDPCKFNLKLTKQPAILTWLREEKLLP